MIKKIVYSHFIIGEEYGLCPIEKVKLAGICCFVDHPSAMRRIKTIGLRRLGR